MRRDWCYFRVRMPVWHFSLLEWFLIDHLEQIKRGPLGLFIPTYHKEGLKELNLPTPAATGGILCKTFLK